MEQLKVISHPEFGKIRTEMVKGEPWFCAKDVCQAFGDNQYKRTLSNLDDDEKGVAHIDTPGGKQQVTIINESGFYHLLFMYQPQKGTNKEIADSRVAFLRKFRKWVTSEVLPSIRKTGEYRVVRSGAKRTEAANVELIELLWTIETFLNRGDKTEIAVELGVSRQSMSYVMNGTQRSPKILKALYERALANKRELKGIYGNLSGALITLKDA